MERKFSIAGNLSQRTRTAYHIRALICDINMTVFVKKKHFYMLADRQSFAVFLFYGG